MNAGNQINILLLAIITTVICFSTVHAELDSSGLTACEQEELMRQIFYPKIGYELQANSLRNKLKQIVENDLVSRGGEYTDDDNQQLYNNIDIDALAKTILKNKRNVANVARLASMRLQNEANPKRSIATLAKNGQLPSREPEPDDQMENQWSDYKRNIGSIARTGILAGKRNIGALARDYVLPPHGGKRNLPSILRSGGGSSTSSTHGPQNPPKRNVASLARDNLYPYYYPNKNENRDILASYEKQSMEEKRNIGAVKNTQRNGRKKRDTTAYDDFPDESELVDTQEIYENTPYNYNDLSFLTNELYPNYGISDISNEKRFLGSVVRDGWSTSSYRPSSQKRNIGSLARQGLLRSDVNSYLNQKQYRQQSEKRHLGALARNGWMPAFRSARGIGRFSRSGRARSRTDGFYPQQERPLQPIAGVCERCRQQHSNSLSWAAPGLNHWGTPPRLTAIQQRSFRGPFHPNDDIF